MKKSKMLVEGPLGFKQTEDQARYLEQLLSTLPKDKGYSYRKKNTTSESVFEPGERASVDIITTDSVDREQEVVLPQGIDLDSYRRNPIVLYAHDDLKPIGKSIWCKVTSNGIKSKTQFAVRPNDYQGDFLPDLVFALVQQQILKGRSIGFVPTEIESPSAEHLKARPDWKNANCLITKSVLFEYSVVSVPCNGEALAISVSKTLKGISLKGLQALGLTLPREKVNEEELLLQILERIEIDPDKIAAKVIERIKGRV